MRKLWFGHRQSNLRGSQTVCPLRRLRVYPRLGWRLHQAGAKGLVLFNRFCQPDIDLLTMRLSRNLDPRHAGGDSAARKRLYRVLSGHYSLGRSEVVPKTFKRFNCCGIVGFSNKMLQLKTSVMFHYVHAAAHSLNRIENTRWQNHRKQS